MKRKGVLREPRPHDTRYKCIECSIFKMRDMYFCNDITRGENTVKRCHQLYHEKYFCKTITPVDSDYDDDTDDGYGRLIRP